MPAEQDILQDGLEFLASQMKTHASTPVVYRRGSQEVTVRATLSSTVFTVDEVEGDRKTFTSIDFDVQAADLAWSGTERRPERRDQIDYGGNTYEVYTPGVERHWRWLSGLVGVRLRIHTKQVGVEG